MKYEELVAESKKKEEEKKKKKDIEKKDYNKIISEDGTLSAFGFNDNYKP